ncbi:hypothetical protein KM1_234120 [Entamoeba histolytica HM-3:IMSS]|uniref:Uncharacterized protein n=1 Tax=Entamoeba histolytica HM-3:IMSS TaxID=885315 RepID=M7WT84_ENTHI|nr:hypothetical protein KM1_234120 [Entamoeba histolytica HM-3:IMSS]
MEEINKGINLNFDMEKDALVEWVKYGRMLNIICGDFVTYPPGVKPALRTTETVDWRTPFTSYF